MKCKSSHVASLLGLKCWEYQEDKLYQFLSKNAYILQRCITKPNVSDFWGWLRIFVSFHLKGLLRIGYTHECVPFLETNLAGDNDKLFLDLDF